MKIKFILVLLISISLLSCQKNSGSDVGEFPGGETGKAGSLAKFAINGDHLFLINKSELKVFDISSPDHMTQINTLKVNYGIETVFTLNDYLFIGAADGMYIYGIADPLNILFQARYEHIQSCDPVVANDSLAFVTLNSQSACRWQNGTNQLDVIDISNTVYPQLVSSLNLYDPKGLGIDANHVFVCDGSNGVRIYDFSNPAYLVQVSGVSGVDAYDVILDNHIMYLVGNQGLFQYNYEDIHHIQLLSNILF